MEESNLEQNPPINVQPQNNIPQSPPVEVKPPNPKNKFPIILIIFLFVIFLIIGGYIFLENRQLFQDAKRCQAIARICKDGTMAKPGIANCSQICPEDSISPTPTLSSDTTANWKTYTNSKIEIQIKYPANWYIEERDNGFKIAPVKQSLHDYSQVIIINASENPKNLTVEEFTEEGVTVQLPNGKIEKPHYTFTPILIDGIEGKINTDIPGAFEHYTVFIKNNNMIYEISWVKGPGLQIEKKTFDQILSTFKFTPASPAGGDQNQTTDNSGLKTYTSPLGISFTYSPKQASNSDWIITVKESGNKICVTYDANDTNCSKGQYVQVFQKSPTDSLENAIKKQFLTNYSSTDCFVSTTKPYSGFSYPVNYKTAIISFPETTDPNASPWANADKCPATYTATNGISYFLEDTVHPTKLLFFSIGQYAIESDNNKSWEQTIKVLN